MNFLWCAEIDLDTSNLFQLGLELFHSEQAGPWRWINQYVQVAILPVFTSCGAAEDTRIGHPSRSNKLANRLPMLR